MNLSIFQTDLKTLLKPYHPTRTHKKGGLLRWCVDMKFRASPRYQKGAEGESSTEGNKPKRKFTKAKAVFRKFTNKGKKGTSDNKSAEEIDSIKSTKMASDQSSEQPPQSSDSKPHEHVMGNSATSTPQHNGVTPTRRHSGGSISRAGAGRRKSGGGKKYHGGRSKRRLSKDPISFDDPAARIYDQIPLLDVTKLPRGGISIETAAVGHVQVSFLSAILTFYRWTIHLFSPLALILNQPHLSSFK